MRVCQVKLHDTEEISANISSELPSSNNNGLDNYEAVPSHERAPSCVKAPSHEIATS